jgi:hypothetical protein
MPRIRPFSRTTTSPMFPSRMVRAAAVIVSLVWRVRGFWVMMSRR